MKKKIVLAITFTVASLLCVTHNVWTNVNGAQGQLTSAPTSTGTELNCLTAGCHVGNPVNASGGTLAVRLMDGTTEATSWVAGKTYNVNVTLVKEGAIKYGFEICAKKGSTSTNMGTFTKGTGTRISIGTSNYITHDNAVATGNWTFTWTAPAASSDPVTFYLAGNAANGDNTSNGDFIYTMSKSIASSTASIRESEFSSNVKVIENPVNQHLVVDFNPQSQGNASIKVYSMQGTEIKLPVSLQGNGLNKRFVVETASLQQGMYIFSLQSGDEYASKKFLKE
jgi:hypothetical protein